ncbi:MAG: hypothetical protein R2849_19260 [Thermomicrobiales bacterium]
MRDDSRDDLAFVTTKMGTLHPPGTAQRTRMNLRNASLLGTAARARATEGY